MFKKNWKIHSQTWPDTAPPFGCPIFRRSEIAPVEIYSINRGSAVSHFLRNPGCISIRSAIVRTWAPPIGISYDTLSCTVPFVVHNVRWEKHAHRRRTEPGLSCLVETSSARMNNASLWRRPACALSREPELARALVRQILSVWQSASQKRKGCEKFQPRIRIKIVQPLFLLVSSFSVFSRFLPPPPDPSPLRPTPLTQPCMNINICLYLYIDYTMLSPIVSIVMGFFF